MCPWPAISLEFHIIFDLINMFRAVNTVDWNQKCADEDWILSCKQNMISMFTDSLLLFPPLSSVFCCTRFVFLSEKPKNQTPICVFLLDFQAAVPIFRLEMESFKLTQRSVALVRSPKDPLLEAASGTADQSTKMLEFLLAKKPVHRDILQVHHQLTQR